MFALLASLLLVIGTNSQARSSIITFPTSFTSLENVKINPSEVKNCYQKGLDAVQSVAGLVQNLMLREPINFATKNWAMSPLSLAAVFAQLLMGSRGEIREILTQALSLVDDGKSFNKFQVHRQLGNLLKHLNHPEGEDYVLLLSGVVFLQSGFPLKATYKHALMDFYNTQILPVDFTGKSMDPFKKINKWVIEATRGRFSEVMPSPLPPNMVSLMANVVYFKSSWEMPFDPEYTQQGMFFIDQTKKVLVDYMYGEQQVLYGNTSLYQLIGLPFKTRDIVIYILLPNGKFSTRLAMKEFDAMASSARMENVTLILPKVKITTTFSVKDAIGKYLRKGPLNEHGYEPKRSNKNFTRLNELEEYANLPLYRTNSGSYEKKTNSFDMGGASEDIRFKIDDIIHKVAFQMDETGTELVGITSTLVDHFGSEFILKVNRPFLFFVRHEPTLSHLFWGLVVNPGESS